MSARLDKPYMGGTHPHQGLRTRRTLRLGLRTLNDRIERVPTDRICWGILRCCAVWAVVLVVWMCVLGVVIE